MRDEKQPPERFYNRDMKIMTEHVTLTNKWNKTFATMENEFKAGI